MGLLGGAWDAVAGVGDHATGSVDESIGRQFDDTPGGGFIEWSNQDRDEFDRDTNGSDEFGDGSNRWIPGTIETIQGDGKADVSGVLDAAALNFDEGVGGLVSLVDAEPGNTAGPGQSPIIETPEKGQPGNPGTTTVHARPGRRRPVAPSQHRRSSARHRRGGDG
jgi:hypothetical protein